MVKECNTVILMVKIARSPINNGFWRIHNADNVMFWYHDIGTLARFAWLQMVTVLIHLFCHKLGAKDHEKLRRNLGCRKEQCTCHSTTVNPRPKNFRIV